MNTETINTTLINIVSIISRYINEGTVINTVHPLSFPFFKGNEDTTSIVFAEMILLTNELRNNKNNEWYNEDWREVVLELKEYAYLFSFLNDVYVTEWGGNLEPIIHNFITSIKSL